MAFINEEYKYFPNIQSNNYSFGIAKSLIAKYDLNYEVNRQLILNTVIQNTYTDGEGSNIGNNDRNIFSSAILGKHALTDKFEYEAGLRKEITNNYESPLLFSLGANYQLSQIYQLKVNASKNFRIPTYNDLYWSAAGNPELNPEESLQAQFGNQLQHKNLEAGLTFYYNDLTNMIRW